MTYVDGFILPIPRKSLKSYLEMAKKAGKIWKEHGALDYKEAIEDDLKVKGHLAFPAAVKLKKSEVVFFSYIVFKSRSHRDKVNAKVMADSRIAAMCNSKKMPFDVKRMVYGGFKVAVDAK